jgi:hypothetical protein
MDDPRDLRSFVIDELLAEDDEPEEAADRLLEQLAETLRSGDFALVVAAPLIPDGIEKVIEYLNARGLSIFGLEVSYFAGEVEAFVPRIVVRPTVGGRIAAGEGHASSRASIDPEEFLGSLPEHVVARLADFLEFVPATGAELQWRQNGPRIRVRGSAGPKVIASFDKSNCYITIGAVKGIDSGPAQHAVEHLEELHSARCGSYYASLNWRKASGSDVDTYLSVARNFIRELTADA